VSRALLAGLALPLVACGHSTSAPPSSQPIPAVTGAAVFVVNGADSSVSVIDVATRAVVGTIALVDAPFPHHIYASADGQSLLVAVPGVDLSEGHDGGGHGGHGSGAVMKLDSSTGATLAVAQLDAANHNAIFAPGGTEVWTSQMTEPGSVVVLDAVTLAPTQTLTVGAMPAEVTFSPDRARAFIANSGESSISVFDAATKAALTPVGVGQTPVGAWPGRDGLMYVDNELDRTLSVIDPATLAVVRTYDLGFTPALAAVAPGGELWVTDTDAGRVVVFTAGSDVVLGSITTGAGAHAIAFSDDGATAYVTNQTAGTVSVIDVATRAVQATIAVGAAPNGIVFRAALAGSSGSSLRRSAP
jgi:YVTN family beta-propeller protein